MSVGRPAVSSRLGYPLSRGQSLPCKRFKVGKTYLPRVALVWHQFRILFQSQLYGTIKSDNRKSGTEKLQKEQQARLGGYWPPKNVVYLPFFVYINVAKQKKQTTLISHANYVCILLLINKLCRSTLYFTLRSMKLWELLIVNWTR